MSEELLEVLDGDTVKGNMVLLIPYLNLVDKTKRLTSSDITTAADFTFITSLS
jgi:hypothetical protein